MAGPSRPARPSLLPREHGAYAQLGVALLCALALAPGRRSLAQAALTAALFFASEPLLILRGQRGAAAQAAGGKAAWGRLASLGGLAVLALAVAWLGAQAACGWALLPPAGLGLALFGLFLAGQERTAAGELLAAWTFAAAAPPVALLGGARPGQAVTLALILACLFSLGTAVVHGHLLALRKGRTGAPRLAGFLLGAVLMGAAWALGHRGLLPTPAALCFLPMTLAALGIWRIPPAPRHLKRVGWAAAFCALAGGALAVVLLLLGAGA